MAEQVTLVVGILAACWSFGTAGYKSYGIASSAIGLWRLRCRLRLEQRHRVHIAVLAKEVAAVLDEDAKHDELLADLALRAGQPPTSSGEILATLARIAAANRREEDEGNIPPICTVHDGCSGGTRGCSPEPKAPDKPAGSEVRCVFDRVEPARQPCREGNSSAPLAKCR